MISLFLKPPVNSRTNIVFPRMKYIQDRFAGNLKKVKQYYVLARKPVPSNHPLVRLLMSMHIATDDFDRLADLAQMSAYSLSSSLNINSLGYREGFMPRSWFYGSTVREYIYFKDSNFKPVGSWEDIEAVVVDYHPRSDISFYHLDGSHMTPEIGYAVITIDPVALYYQYRQWWKTQKLLPPSERLNVSHFLGMYVIPGMIRSHLNVAFINRTMKHLRGETPEEPIKRNLTALPSTQTFLDETAQDIAEKMIRSQLHFKDIVQNVPLPFGENLLDIVAIPVEPPTITVKVYRALRALPYMELLTSIDINTHRTSNKDQYSEWISVIKRLRNERLYDGLGSMSPDLYARLKNNVEAYIP